MKITELNAPVQPDTYEASMFIKQAIRAGKYSIQIHNLLSNDQEVEAWVQKKIDLATNYISTVGHYLEGQEMTEDVMDPGPLKGEVVVKKFATDNPETKFILVKTSNGKFKVNYSMDVNIGGTAVTGAQTKNVFGNTNEFDNANDAIEAGKKDAADYYKKELIKSKEPYEPEPDSPFDVEDWSTGKVKEFGADLMRLAKGQPIEMPGYDSYGMELDDGRPYNDDEGNEAADDSIGGEVTSAIRMHRGDIEDMDGIADADKVKPNRETIKYAQAIINSPEFKKAWNSNESVTEDAGEGHMAKSQLYAAAKYCMKIATRVRPGDDIEAWVQTKMNKAVDYLDAVYHYEDYQRMNPYREALGDEHAKHGEIIKNKIDEILEFELPIDDIETKPGMFNILKRRVNEFEKKMCKEGSRMPSQMIRNKQKLDALSPEEINDFFQKRAHFFNKPAKELARQQELRFGKNVAAMAPYSRHVQEYAQSPFKQQIINKLKKPADDYLANKQPGEYTKKLQQKLQGKLIDKTSV